MSLLDRIKENARRMADECAGRPDYFWQATTYRILYEGIQDALTSFSGGRLLDAGAGRLAYRELLLAHCERYESLDIVNWRGEIDHMEDIQNMHIPDASYDAAFCSQVIHHVPEPQAALSELFRVLKPGGRLLLTVPHLCWLHNEPHDYYRFTRHGLRHILEKAGFEVESIAPNGGLICFLAFIPSNLALALAWPIRPLHRLVFWLNVLFVRFALWLDSKMGFRDLFPTNYVAVARRPSESP